MKVKKIKCLKCNTILESDFDLKDYESFVECGCSNKTSLQNYFTFSQPGSIVRANNKILVEAQLLYDTDWGKIGDWWVLGVTDKTKYTEWSGRLEEGGFVGGLSVDFKTPQPMTHNECRTYLKTNRIIDKSEGTRISKVDRGVK